MVNTDCPMTCPISATNASYGLGFRRRTGAVSLDPDASIRRRHR